MAMLDNTTITISKNLARRLWMWKKNLDVNSLEEVIDKILKIVPATELNNYMKKKSKSTLTIGGIEANKK